MGSYDTYNVAESLAQLIRPNPLGSIGGLRRHGWRCARIKLGICDGLSGI